MTNWRYTLDIKAEYKEAKAGTLTPHAMAQRIAAKMRMQFSPLSYALDEIVDMFEAIDERDTFDDTDIAMEMLYDWGDRFSGINGKMCWVATF